MYVSGSLGAHRRLSIRFCFSDWKYAWWNAFVLHLFFIYVNRVIETKTQTSKFATKRRLYSVPHEDKEHEINKVMNVSQVCRTDEAYNSVWLVILLGKQTREKSHKCTAVTLWIILSEEWRVDGRILSEC